MTTKIDKLRRERLALMDCVDFEGVWAKEIGKSPIAVIRQGDDHTTIELSPPDVTDLSTSLRIRREDGDPCLRVYFVPGDAKLWWRSCRTWSEALTVTAGALGLIVTNDNFGVSRTDTVKQLGVVYGGEVF